MSGATDPNPPHADWPGGARIAVQLVLNYEEGGEASVLHGDAGAETFLSDMINPAPVPAARHMSMEQIYEYGSRAGVWRLLRLFERHAVPVTVFGVAMALERNPAVVEACLQAGHEIASHGWRWINYQDVPEAVSGAYRTARTRTGWGLAGYSTGGFCAAKLLLLHSDRFSAAASMAGHFDALLDRTTRELYGGSKQIRRSSDLVWRLRNLPQPPVSVLVASADVGEKTYPSAQRFMRAARPPLVVDKLLLPTGGHNFKTFRKYIPPSIAWLSGSQSEMAYSTSGMSSRGMNSPPRMICGKTSTGMNCTAWNSVVAKALASRPRAVPSTASTTATSPSCHSGPSTSRPHTYTAKATVTIACSTAISPNASA